MHVGLLTNYNLYESKRYFCQKFKEAFERAGVEVTLLDMKTIEQYPQDFLRMCDREATDFTCSFNSMIPTNDGQFLQDVTGVPHVAFLVDPAFYYSDLFSSKNTVITCVDHFDVEFARSNHADNVLFLGHATEKDLKPNESLEKIYDIVLIGSCYDHETLEAFWKKNMTKAEIDVIQLSIELLTKRPYKPIHEAVHESFVSLNYPFDSHMDSLNKIKTYGTIVDNYIRGRDRTELIKAICKKHTVHVFGGKCWRDQEPVLGWDYSLRNSKNVVIHNELSFSDALEVLKSSKISLNSMPFFKNGTHERIFTSFACGAFVVNSPNLWVERNFSPNENIFVYDPQNLSKVADDVVNLLENEKKRQTMVASGRHNVLLNHTWDNRVQDLLKHLRKKS